MKQLTIISGKGGTGKTTLTAAFAHLADNAVIADCDVDAADLHLILTPDIIRLNRLSVVEYPCAKVTDEVKRIWRKVEGCLFAESHNLFA